MATSQVRTVNSEKKQETNNLIIYTAYETLLLPLRHAPCLVFYTHSTSVLKHLSTHMYSEQPQTKQYVTFSNYREKSFKPQSYCQ